MISQAALEQATLALLCFSPEQAPMLAVKITDYNLFTNAQDRQLAKTALEYINKYATCPGTQLELLLEKELRGTDGKLLQQSIDLLEKNAKQLTPIFIIEQLDRFLETQRLQNALQEAMELTQQGDIEKAREVMFRQNVSPQTSSAILFQDPSQSLSFLNRDEETEFFSSGIDTADMLGARPERKTVTVFIAPAGKGKTWWLVEVGKRGMQHHHKVLHITLELSQEKTSRRYVQSVFSLTKDEAETIRVPFFEKDPATGGTTLQFTDIMRESVYNKRKDISRRMSEMTSYPPLYIKEFPTSTLTVEQLYMYLESLKREFGFEPDELIIDYPDLMRLDAAMLRIDTGRLFRELRGLAVSRNTAMVVVTQGNRESETARVVGVTNVAEDWSKIGTADNIFTYSQTLAEYRLGLARLFLPKVRDAVSNYLIVITQAYPIGQFALSSTLMDSELSNQMKALMPEEKENRKKR